MPDLQSTSPTDSQSPSPPDSTHDTTAPCNGSGVGNGDINGKSSSTLKDQISSFDQTPSADENPSMEEIPSLEDVSSFPKAWYKFGTTRELSRGPVTKKMMGESLVGFVTESGKAGVMQSRCCHLGSDLGNGCVVGESIKCPFHGWEYGIDGACTRIPASKTIPDFAGQVAWPTQILYGNVYFFNDVQPAYPLPFFEGIDPSELVAARPFEFVVEAPWYMIGSNAVDKQHFLGGHDRQIVAGPDVDFPRSEVHHTIASFKVVGTSIPDRLTKILAGDKVTLDVYDWGSTYILTRSTLRKTESFGILSTIPIGPRKTIVNVTACGWKSKSAIQQAVWDPPSAEIRRYFIKEFLRPDVKLFSQTEYSPNTLLDIDQQMVEYMQWVASLPR